MSFWKSFVFSTSIKSPFLPIKLASDQKLIKQNVSKIEFYIQIQEAEFEVQNLIITRISPYPNI